MVACFLDEFEHVFTFILSSFVIWGFTCVIHLFELLLHHFVGLYFFSFISSNHYTAIVLENIQK